MSAFQFRNNRWIYLAAVALLLRLLFGFFPALAETLYAEGLFVVIRYCFDYTLALLPFSSVLIVAAFFLWLLFRYIKSSKRLNQAASRKQKGLNFLKGTLNVVAFLFFWFLFLWGFNYARPSVEDQVGMEAPPIPLEEIKATATSYLPQVLAARQAIPNQTDSALTASFLPHDLEDQVRESLEAALTTLGYAPHGQVRCRLVKPEGFLRAIGIQGIYMPFSGEGHVDASLHPILIPFTMAHEMAHGYGFTDEGTANFLAWLACEHAQDPMIRYSGQAALFQYLRADLRRFDPEYYRTFLDKMPAALLADRRAVIKNAKQFPNKMPGVAQAMNDIYLKSQGVKEGISSYSRVVVLALAWQKRS